MVACAITAFCPIHNTCSNESTTVSGVGEFIASCDVPSVETVFRHCHSILDRWKHHITAYCTCQFGGGAVGQYVGSFMYRHRKVLSSHATKFY